MSIIVVSGLPRSGTSMLMQMLEAGGCPVLKDEARPPDPDNPKGYYEFEAVKSPAGYRSWIPRAEGKAVKVVAQLLRFLPPYQPGYHVILISRAMDEVMASQEAMLMRLGRTGAALDRASLAKVFARHLDEARELAGKREDMRLLGIEHREVLQNPGAAARSIADFLASGLDVQAMASAVDPALYRRKPSS